MNSRIRRAREIYRGMSKEAQDIPEAEFVRRYMDATDPVTIRQDLEAIRTKMKIDRGLRHGKIN